MRSGRLPFFVMSEAASCKENFEWIFVNHSHPTNFNLLISRMLGTSSKNLKLWTNQAFPQYLSTGMSGKIVNMTWRLNFKVFVLRKGLCLRQWQSWSSSIVPCAYMRHREKSILNSSLPLMVLLYFCNNLHSIKITKINHSVENYVQKPCENAQFAT